MQGKNVDKNPFLKFDFIILPLLETQPVYILLRGMVGINPPPVFFTSPMLLNEIQPRDDLNPLIIYKMSAISAFTNIPAHINTVTLGLLGKHWRIMCPDQRLFLNSWHRADISPFTHHFKPGAKMLVIFVKHNTVYPQNKGKE